MLVAKFDCTRFQGTMEDKGEASAIVLGDNKQQQPSPKSIDLPEGLILVSSSSSDDGSQDEDHEEGEIPDEDCVEEEKENVRGRTSRRVQHDLEDISSEEESNIRERLAELVAMNKELKMIAHMNNYSFLSKADGKDIYYNQHNQHARRRKEGKSSTPTSKPSSRRQTVRRERLITSKRHSEKRKDRQSKQDRRNAHRRHKRRKCVSPATTPLQRSTFAVETSESECEFSYDREFLACSIDNGRKRRLTLNENALKRKLLLPLNGGKREKSRREGVKHNDVVPMVTIDSSASDQGTPEPFVVDDDDDDDGDEEELQLRLLALRTKPIVKEACLDEIFDDYQVPSPPPPPIISGDGQDGSENCPDNHFAPLERLGSEERELRMIALKSAYTKKHEARLRLKGFGKESERPYSPSDNLVLSPVDEIPPIYDELDNGLFSDGNGSAGEALRPIEDTDDNGNDMEISPADSPARWPIPNETTEDSQLPIDMELASSDPSSELPSESIVFASEPLTDRAKVQSPPMTPDSMGEAEADALRHFLLSKMRQKQKDTAFVETQAEVSSEVPMELEQPVPLADEMDKQSPLATMTNVLPDETSSVQNVKATSPKTGNSNLITLVNRKMVRKRRKKSLSVANGPGNTGIDIVGGPKNVTGTTATGDAKQPQSETSTVVPKLQVVRTQKLLNNQNKLINLNHTISPSPPLLSATAFAIVRTESPKEWTNVETFVSRPVSRMVIQLGNSDSDSEVDFGSPSPSKTSDGVAVAALPTRNAPAPGPAFEQQLDRFLRSVRSKTVSNPVPTTDDAKESPECSGLNASTDNSEASRQQLMVKKTQSIPADVMATVATSAAVKHLPKSAQLEYTRLIARMAQLERQKNARQRRLSAKNGKEAVVRSPTDSGTNVQQQSLSDAIPAEKSATNASSETISQEPNTQSDPVDRPNKQPAIVLSPGKRKAAPLTEVTVGSAAEIQDPVLRKLHQIKSRLPTISEEGRSRLLLTTERHLAKHSDFFLRQLEQHNAMLVEVQQERHEMFQLENRIELMREKLAALERAHDNRRKRSFESFTSVQTSHRRIVADRKRSVELARVCVTIGRLVLGDVYQPPSASAEAHLQEQLRILVNETKQLKFIRKPSLEEFKNRILATRRTVLVAESVRAESAPVVEPEPEDTQNTEPDPLQTPPMAEAQGQSFGSQELESQAHQPEPSTGTTNHDVFASPERPRDEELPQSDTEVPAETEPMVIGHVEPTINESNTSHEAANEPNASTIECTVNEVQQDLTNRPEVVESMPGKSVHGSEDGFSEPVRFTEYKSPLVSLKQPGAPNTTPNGILCPYELDGQCVDRDCKFDHLRQP